MASQPGRDPTNIQVLPPELLAIVFGYLDSNRQSNQSLKDKNWLLMTLPSVCKQWCGACKLVPVDIALDADTITDAGLRSLVGRFPLARDIAFSGDGWPDYRPVDHDYHGLGAELTCDGLLAMAGWQNVRTLDLTGVSYVTDDVLSAIATALPQAEHLAIAVNKYVYDEWLGEGYGLMTMVTDAGLKAVGENTSLRSIFLSGCHKVTDAGLRDLAAGCPGLREVTLRRLPRVTDEGIMALAVGCPDLRRLAVYHPFRVKAITAAGVTAVAEHLGRDVRDFVFDS